MAKSGDMQEFASGFMEPLSGAIKAYADIAVAQANANTAIINSQQKTAQAALAVNPNILHELDRPVVNLKGKIGRGKNAPVYEVNASILDLFAFGSMVEGINKDMDDFAHQGEELPVRDFRMPGWFNQEWDDVRTPRTQISGYSKIGQMNQPDNIEVLKTAIINSNMDVGWKQIMLNNLSG